MKSGSLALAGGLCALAVSQLALAEHDTTPARDIRAGRLALQQNHPQAALNAFNSALEGIQMAPERYSSDLLAALSGKGYAALWLAAFFGFLLIAGPITLLLIPLAALNNMVIYSVQRRMFKARGLRIRRNLRGMFLYVFFSQLLMSPASIAGYASEVLRLSKSWGTK